MSCVEENEIVLYPKFSFSITTNDENCSHYRCQVVCPVSATNSVTIIDDNTPSGGGVPSLPAVPASRTFTRDIDYAALPSADPYLNKTHWVRFEFYYYYSNVYTLLHVSTPQAIRVQKLSFVISKNICDQSIVIRIRTNSLAPLNCSNINNNDITLRQNNSNLSYTHSVQQNTLVVNVSPNPELGDVTLSMNKNCGSISVSYSALIPIYYYKYFSFIIRTDLGLIWYVSFRTNDPNVNYTLEISDDLQDCTKINIVPSMLSNNTYNNAVNLTNECNWSSEKSIITTYNKRCLCKKDVISFIEVKRCRVIMSCNNICFVIEPNLYHSDPNYNITHITIQLETSTSGIQEYTVTAIYDDVSYEGAIVGCIENYNISGFVEVSEASISIYDPVLEQTTSFVLCEMSGFYLLNLNSINVRYYDAWAVYHVTISHSFPNDFSSFNWSIILRNLNRNRIHITSGNASNWSNIFFFSHIRFYNAIRFIYDITDDRDNRYFCGRIVQVSRAQLSSQCEFRMNCNNLCFTINVLEEVYTASGIQEVMIQWKTENGDIEEHIVTVSYDASQNILEACINNYNVSGVMIVSSVGIHLYYRDLGTYNETPICEFSKLYIIHLNRISISYDSDTSQYTVSIGHTFPPSIASEFQMHRWTITIRDNSSNGNIIYQNGGDFNNWSSNITFTHPTAYAALNFEYQIQLDDILYSCSRPITVLVRV